MTHIEDGIDTTVELGSRLKQRNGIQRIQDNHRPLFFGLLRVLTEFSPCRDKLMTTFLTLITLLSIKKPFLDDAGFIHSANRSDSVMNTLYECIELDEIEDLPIKPP